MTVPCNDLSILCVTKAESCVLPCLRQLEIVAGYVGAEMVMVLDGVDEYLGQALPRVDSRGYIESVLDQAIAHTTRSYVFRIDDDESMPTSLISWLYNGGYRAAPHWKFSRAHLWGSEARFITNPPLWPDHQTRLSIRAMAGDRHTVHCGSPHGGGDLAPAPLLHHKFLVRGLDDRLGIVDRYEQAQAGAGYNFSVFSTPELVLPDIRTEFVSVACQWAMDDAKAVA